VIVIVIMGHGLTFLFFAVVERLWVEAVAVVVPFWVKGYVFISGTSVVEVLSSPGQHRGYHNCPDKDLHGRAMLYFKSLRFLLSF
jgi:hypothetical protein